jgi:hypothetical protein
LRLREHGRFGAERPLAYALTQDAILPLAGW